MSERTGGPAFPVKDLDKHWNGLELRDYFAAQALCAVYRASIEAGNDSQESIAQEAYELADAMLLERAK